MFLNKVAKQLLSVHTKVVEYIPKCNIMHYTGHRKQWTVNQSGNWLVSLWSQKVLFDNKHGFHELLMSCASVCYEVCHGL